MVTGKLTLWRWDLASAHFVDQVDVHVRTGPTVVGYDVLVSPDFRRFAVHEWGQQSQTLVFETTGRLLWTSPSGMPQTIDMAWSNDGTKIALAAVPAPWTVLTFGTDGSVSQMSYNLPGGSTYGLLSFDAGGLHLIGFKSPGKVGFWQNPVSLDLAAGSDTVPAALDAFPTGLSSSATQSWVNQINPRSGDVLSQTGTSWWQVTSAGTTPLDASRVESLAWADANTIVMVGPPPAAPVPPLGATFPAADALGIWTASAEHPNTTHVVRRYAGMFMPSGAGYSPVGLLAAGHGYAVVYVGAPPCCVGGPIGQGLSKVELVDLQSGTAAAGTVPDGAPAGTTFSFAGWLP